MAHVLSNQLRPALQLWTVRALADLALADTLAQVRDIGYDAIEIYGDGPTHFADMASALKHSGLRCISAHVPFHALQMELPRVVAGLRLMGCATAIVPAFPQELRDTQDKALRLADDLNHIGAALNSANITFAYHNEDYDFAPLGDTALWDTLVAQTDGALVKLQLDTFTAIFMGRDPIHLLQQHGPRLISLHVCDMRARRYVPVGQGELNWSKLVSAASRTAAQWLILEHDAPAAPMADAAASLQALTLLLSA